MNKETEKGSHPRHCCIGSSDSLRGTADNRQVRLQPLWFLSGHRIRYPARLEGNPEQTGI